MRHPLLASAIVVVSLTLTLSLPRTSLAAGEDSLLILIDRSTTMSSSGKWITAGPAIVQALDDNAVDAMSVGLYSAPSGSVSGPVCVFGLPVSCATPTLPQIPLALAGSNKSTAASGVRRQIKDWLAANSPDIGGTDGFPLYAATQSALAALTAQPGPGPRTLLILTDGGISCGQLSSRPGYSDCNACDHEWEGPANIVSLLTAARTDPAKPVQTFVIGLPGADSFDATGCASPPYHMRLALSALAFAGSPSHSAPGCTGTTFTQGGSDPSLSCHADLTLGNFTLANLTNAISSARAAGASALVPLFGIRWLAAALLATVCGALLLRRRVTR